jgi:hypothetical protein
MMRLTLVKKHQDLEAKNIALDTYRVADAYWLAMSSQVHTCMCTYHIFFSDASTNTSLQSMSLL